MQRFLVLVDIVEEQEQKHVSLECPRDADQAVEKNLLLGDIDDDFDEVLVESAASLDECIDIPGFEVILTFLWD